MLAALALSLAAVQPGFNDRPNVLFILADDLGFGDLSAMRQYGGAEDIRTPHVDGLFADGLTFPNFYANCTVCSPTRAALMTGRFPATVGVPGVIRPWPEDNWGYLSPNAPTLPALMKSADYDTALIGKWHLGGDPHNGAFNDPTDRGFDLFRGFRGGMLSDYHAHTRRFPDGSDRNVMTDESVAGTHATDVLSDWAVDYIRGREDQRKNFFLYLAYNAPHTPIQPPPEWVEKVAAPRDRHRPEAGEARGPDRAHGRRRRPRVGGPGRGRAGGRHPRRLHLRQRRAVVGRGEQRPLPRRARRTCIRGACGRRARCGGRGSSNRERRPTRRP